jgi:hypothetical protein
MVNDFDHRILRRHNFGLVDSSMMGELPEGIIAARLVPDGLEASAHLMPCIIDFRTLTADDAAVLLEHLYSTVAAGNAPPVQMLVNWEGSPAEFAKYWNRIQLPHLSTWEKFWFRMHDPRVFHQVWRILDLGQRHHLLRHVPFVTYWLGGEWCVARRDEAHILTHQDVWSTAPDGWDWTRIRLIGVVNRVMQRAGISIRDEITNNSPRVEELAKRAQTRHGLGSVPDIVEFAARGLALRSNFDDHPSVLAALRGITDDSDLADRFALIDERVWNELRAIPLDL